MNGLTKCLFHEAMHTLSVVIVSAESRVSLPPQQPRALSSSRAVSVVRRERQRSIDRLCPELFAVYSVTTVMHSGTFCHYTEPSSAYCETALRQSPEA